MIYYDSVQTRKHKCSLLKLIIFVVLIVTIGSKVSLDGGSIVLYMYNVLVQLKEAVVDVGSYSVVVLIVCIIMHVRAMKIVHCMLVVH